MIDPEDRLWSGSCSLFNGGPYVWDITDLDQRRFFSVKYAPTAPVENPHDTGDICIAQLQKHVDNLGKGVYGISFSEPNGPINLSFDREDDCTHIVNCYPLSALELPFNPKTVYRTSLTEIGRLGPEVDLVSYQETLSDGKPSYNTAAFKYWFLFNGMWQTWYELNCWIRLPSHPHIVPFESVVLNDMDERIIGFTSSFISGGTLKDTDATTRPFRIQWLRQLLSVVDDLNYQYGVMHQDIAARNLVIDSLGNLRIFDFNYAVMIGRDYLACRDDTNGVIFTLYEILTLDEHFRDVPHEEQNVEAVLQMEWEKHPNVKLDSDIQVFRSTLDEWVAKRKATVYKPRDTWVQWPRMPPPLPGPVLKIDGPKGEPAQKEMRSVPYFLRKNLIEFGEPYLDWERPAGYRLTQALAKDAEDDVRKRAQREEPNEHETWCAFREKCIVL